MIALLCGGVGGSKIALGLYRTLPLQSLTVIVNTADDSAFWGLHVSPDLDTVTYTLAGIVGERGWGLRDDTFEALKMLGRFCAEDWFQIGDRDLATHVYRTHALRTGHTLTEISDRIARALDVRAHILPMTDRAVATRVRTGPDWIDFQEYFVHQRHSLPVDAIRYEGLDQADATPEVLQALHAAEIVVLANSNPVLSILPILSLPAVRSTLQALDAPRVAVSPMIGEASVTGPAGELMRTVNQPASSLGVARLYAGLIDGIVIAREDAALTPEIETLGIRVMCTDTVMRNDPDKERLALEVAEFARGLR